MWLWSIVPDHELSDFCAIDAVGYPVFDRHGNGRENEEGCNRALWLVTARYSQQYKNLRENVTSTPSTTVIRTAVSMLATSGHHPQQRQKQAAGVMGLALPDLPANISY